MYKNFKDMPVWEKVMNIAIMIFELSNKLPKKEG